MFRKRIGIALIILRTLDILKFFSQNFRADSSIVIIYIYYCNVFAELEMEPGPNV